MIQTNTFGDLGKYVLRFEQIHLAIWTNTLMVRSFAKLEEEEATCKVEEINQWLHNTDEDIDIASG